MGGNLPEPPPFLPHGEKPADFVATNKTKIDWLAYTSAKSMDAVQLGISVLWPTVVFENRGRGMVGFPESMEVVVDGIVYGLIGFGAKHERIFVSLTGVGCSTLGNEGIENAYEMLTLLDARLSRVDVALDFYNGERTWDHALWSYLHADGFKPRRGGHRPEHKRVEGQSGDGKNLGRTLYIGIRGESEKFVRIYEKGLEVFANLPKDLRDASDARALVFSLDDQQYADRWLRIELEFTRQKRDLPLDMLLKRDEYFAGAYPYCADSLGLADGLRPVSLKDDTEVDLIKLIGHGKRAYGSLIFTLKELGFTDAEVVQYLSGDRPNAKLVRSGMLSKIKTRQAELLAQCPDHDIPF
jgi:phage replication initiation protein